MMGVEYIGHFGRYLLFDNDSAMLSFTIFFVILSLNYYSWTTMTCFHFQTRFDNLLLTALNK